MRLLFNFCYMFRPVRLISRLLFNTGRFEMFSEITNNYNKKTKGPAVMELNRMVYIVP
jgi:hypothetical protein